MHLSLLVKLVFGYNKDFILKPLLCFGVTEINDGTPGFKVSCPPNILGILKTMEGVVEVTEFTLAKESAKTTPTPIHSPVLIGGWEKDQ